MEPWKSAQRVHERKLWNTLLWVGLVLTLTLAGSIVVGTPTTGAGAGAWFYVQQSVLLLLSAAGTALAFRRRRAVGTPG